MSLLSSSIGGGVRFHADEDADHNMLQDLQLAAELGKTLLERNKELENIIKLNQATVEEQAQEIEYMKKQTAALKEVNNTRLKVYEQLEVSVQDLERANHHLIIENTSDKKLIKSQSTTIENLEVRCEELQKKIDELIENLRQRAASPFRNNAQQENARKGSDWKTSDTQGGSEKQRAAPNSPKCSQETIDPTAANDDEMTELLRQLQEARSQRAREQKKVLELSQQLTTILQENAALEEQLTELHNKAQDVKSLQDEISTLEEVRRGQLCGRCLRGIDTRTHDEFSIMLDHEEYDDISMAESLASESQRDAESTIQDTGDKNEGTNETYSANPYRDLVEKYRALQEMRYPLRRKDGVPPACISLQEELEMSGEFNNFYPTASETEVTAVPESTKTSVPRAKPEIANKKPFSATPTDFSEAETSSSGFSDETSNKATQTDNKQGSFLCSIADGEDCKFSIYDDNSPFESRFRKTPEYRQLFSEIFSVLKRAAEAKDEGEKLPLLDDSTTSHTTTNQETFQEDRHSEATDDNQSVMSSMVSSVVSEPVFRMQSVSPPKKDGRKADNKPAGTAAANGQHDGKDGSCRMDYVSLNLRMRKKKNSAKKVHNDRSCTPDVIPTTNPKLVPPKSSGGGRRRFKPFNPADHEYAATWVGQHNACPNRSRDKRQQTFTRGPIEQQHQQQQQQQQQQHNNYEYRDYKPSTASEEVARLKRLELSYAEVLRTPNNKLRSNNHNNNNHHHHHHHHNHRRS